MHPPSHRTHPSHCLTLSLSPHPLLRVAVLSALMLSISGALITGAARAQERSPAGEGRGKPSVMRMLREVLFPPQLVLRSREELELSDAQLARLKALLKEARSAEIDHRFALDDAALALRELLSTQPINEQAALTKADEVMGHERALKQTRLRLMIQVKNLLTEPQRSILERRREERRAQRRERRRGRAGERRERRRSRRHRRRWRGGEGASVQETTE